MSIENITKEQVLHIADLTNIKLSEDEVVRLSKMLTDTVSYIKILEELKTDDVKETYQVTGTVNVYQEEDETKNTLTQEEALNNASEQIKGYFVTKAVFER